jgi:anti-sigma factor RsiW
MNEFDPAMEADLNAYVDNQLDLESRLRIENHLARHPEAAARVMADLGIRTKLRLALQAEDEAAEPRTREAARKLGAALEGRQAWIAARRVAAVLMLVSVGWLANNAFNPFGPAAVNASTHPPDFVGQAVAAHKTAEMRLTMRSQPARPTFDPEDIRAKTAIVMPELPKGWRVLDVEVFPSDFGPSVETAVVTGDGKRMSLFAVRPGHFAVEPVQATTLPDAEAAWWQIGEVAYAVISGERGMRLMDKAEQLKSTLY